MPGRIKYYLVEDFVVELPDSSLCLLPRGKLFSVAI
jgi:hypothetical protein